VRGPDAETLLRKLGSGVRRAPGGASAPRAEDDGFGWLLAEARRGGFTSGRRVTADAALGVELTDGEREDLDRAADAAEAAGARTLAAVSGRSLLRVDVAGREVVEARGLRGEGADAPELLTGVDAVAALGGGDGGDDRTSNDETDAGGDESGASGGAPAARGRADLRPLAPGLRRASPGRLTNASLLRSLGGSHD